MANRDTAVRKALEIRRAVSNGNLNNLDPVSASSLMLIDASRDTCADPVAQNAWKGAVRNLSDSTSAYLSPAELEGIWDKIASSPCYHTIAAEQKTWVDLLAAISRRNAPDIVKFGTDLLDSKAPSSGADLAYLTTVTAAARVQMGQSAQAHSLLEEQWSRCDHSGQYRVPLLTLVALTQTSSPATRAQPMH
jgi:hypothetical protein